MPTRRRPLHYPDKTSEGIARENGLRLRDLYRRQTGKEPPPFDDSGPDWIVRELEIQASLGIGSEMVRKLLFQQPEFHNEPGRPEGSKGKSPALEKDISPSAIRWRRKRAKGKRDKN